MNRHNRKHYFPGGNNLTPLQFSVVFLGVSGKSTGFVVTSKVTHASPAPLYAVSPDRSWETDSELPRHARQHGCKDIGAQLADPVGSKIDVSSYFKDFCVPVPDCKWILIHTSWVISNLSNWSNKLKISLFWKKLDRLLWLESRARFLQLICILFPLPFSRWCWAVGGGTWCRTLSGIPSTGSPGAGRTGATSSRSGWGGRRAAGRRRSTYGTSETSTRWIRSRRTPSSVSNCNTRRVRWWIYLVKFCTRSRSNFLPPANEVLGKVMFLLLCVILFTGCYFPECIAVHMTGEGVCIWGEGGLYPGGVWLGVGGWLAASRGRGESVSGGRVCITDTRDTTGYYGPQAGGNFNSILQIL